MLKRQKSLPSDELQRNSDLSEWVSASSMKSYFLKEPLLEWLPINHSWIEKFYGISNETCPNPLDFTSFIMNKGNEFEAKVNEYLQNKFSAKGEYINIGGSHHNKTIELQNKTIEAINKNIGIISSGVLFNFENQTYGVADLIVHRNYLSEICPSMKEIPESRYVIIDIKYTTLSLLADGIHLGNSDLFPSYKAQVWVYTKALSQILNEKITKGYILGRKWKYETGNLKFSGDGAFERLATIDYAGKDKKYVEETEIARKWIVDVRKKAKRDFEYQKKINSSGDIIDEIEIPLPNMKNDYDYPWRGIKEVLGKNDITRIWQCGVEHRRKFENALANVPKELSASPKSVPSALPPTWTNPRCTAETMGFPKEGAYAPKVDAILNVNRKTSVSRFNVSHLFPPIENGIEFFIDFETVNDSILSDFSNFPKADTQNYIFQIGIGFEEPYDSKVSTVSSRWVYKSFVADRISKEEEKKLCTRLSDYILYIRVFYSIGENFRLYHWSSAEPNCWKNANETFSSKFDFSNEWVDLFQIFKNNNIVVKGAFDFSLKSISNALYDLGLISIKWDTECSNGAMAMIGAHLANQKVLNGTISKLKEDEIIKDIEKYNEYDCKSMYEIIKILRFFKPF